MNEPIDLQACVNKTYQRDGNHCRVEYLDDGVDGAGIRWSEVAGEWQCFDVPEAMLLAWLAGATEVTDGE